MNSHLTILFMILLMTPLSSQEPSIPFLAPNEPLPDTLSPRQKALLVKSIDRGLAYLPYKQNRDGSFGPTKASRPAITSLVIMAYLSRGHKPSQGSYGPMIDRALAFVLRSQRPSGLIAHQDIDPKFRHATPSQKYIHLSSSKAYSHGISMLMLGEVYGFTKSRRADSIRSTIERGLQMTIKLWDIRKGQPHDDGGFRYPRPYHDKAEGDVSVTAWHAASLRSIHNAGFDVPQATMRRISAYVIRNESPKGGFPYTRGTKPTITTTAAGALCISLAGQHKHPSVTRACKFINARRNRISKEKFPYYATYYISQAAIQNGGQFWDHCLNSTYHFLIPAQKQNGSWPPKGLASNYGTTYSTSMAILSLTPTLQILPIYQR